jgi:hypothetical protein
MNCERNKNLRILIVNKDLLNIDSMETPQIQEQKIKE